MLCSKGLVSKNVSHLMANLSVALRCVLVLWHMHTNRTPGRVWAWAAARALLQAQHFPVMLSNAKEHRFSSESEKFW